MSLQRDRGGARGRRALSLLLAVSLLSTPGAGVAQLARDGARLASPLLSRAMASAVARLFAAGAAGSAVALLASPGTASATTAAEGEVWAWGRNNEGQLGDGTTTFHHPPTPGPVLGPGGSGSLGGVTAIDGRADRSMALKSDGGL